MYFLTMTSGHLLNTCYKRKQYKKENDKMQILP